MAEDEKLKETKVPPKPEWLFVQNLLKSETYKTAQGLLATLKLEKPEEAKDAPITISRDECNTLLTAEFTTLYKNPIIQQWEAAGYWEERQKGIKLYGPAEELKVSWDDFMPWAIAEARELGRLYTSIPKPPKFKADAPYNKSLFDFYISGILNGESSGQLSDVVVIAPLSKAQYNVHRIVVASASRYLYEAFKNNPPYITRKVKKVKEEAAGGEEKKEVDKTEMVLNFNKITIPAPIETVSSKSSGKASDDQVERILKYMYSNQDIYKIKEDINESNVFALYAQACALKMKNLQNDLCELITTELINQENCILFYLDAIKFECPVLIKACEDMMVKKFAEALIDSEEALLKLPVNQLIHIAEHDKLNLEHEYQLVKLIENYLKYREKPEIQKPKAKGPIRLQDTEEGLKVWIQLTEQEKKNREEKFAKDTQVENDKKEAKRRLTELQFNVKIKDGVDISKFLVVKHPPIKKDPGDAAGDPEEAKRLEADLVFAAESERTPEDRIQAVLDSAQAKANKKIMDGLKVVKVSKEDEIRLFRTIRFSYLQHQELLRMQNEDRFHLARDLIVQGLAMRLGPFDETKMQEITINLDPRLKYDLPCQARAEMNIVPPLGVLSNEFTETLNAEQRQNLQQKQYVVNPYLLQPARNNLYEQKLHATRMQNQMLGGGSRDNRFMNRSFGAGSHHNHLRSPNRLVKEDVMSHHTMQHSLGARNPQHMPLHQQHRRQGSPIHNNQEIERPSEFVYEYDMDENGALFFLGSHGRRKIWNNPHGNAQVQAFASSIGAGKVEDFVGRTLTNCRTHNEPYSYIGVDLGQDRALLPYVYTVRNRNSTTHVMMNWQFEASNDKINWIALDQRVHMTGRADEDAYLEREQMMLKQKGAVSSWAVDKDIYREIGYEGFRFFRLLQTSKNSSGSDNLALSGFEVYGQVTCGRWP